MIFLTITLSSIFGFIAGILGYIVAKMNDKGDAEQIEMNRID